MNEKNYVFIDAETDGLYGTIISVAMIACNSKYEEIERLYVGIDMEKLKVKDPWVKENVIDILGNYDSCETEEQLLDRVWDFWQKYADNSYAVADVAYPVEDMVFRKCVLKDVNNRKFRAPFPLLDLSSILFSKGIEPLSNRLKLSEMQEQGIQHNALFDVEMSINIMRKVMRNGKSGN